MNNGAEQRDIFFNTLSDNLEGLTDILCSYVTKAEEYKLCGYSHRLVPVVDAYLKKFHTAKLHTNQTAWYRASKETIEKFDIAYVLDIFHLFNICKEISLLDPLLAFHCGNCDLKMSRPSMTFGHIAPRVLKSLSNC